MSDISHYKNQEDSENITKILMIAVGIVLLVLVGLAVISRNSPQQCSGTIEVVMTYGDTVDGKITDLFPEKTDHNKVKAEIARLNQWKKNLGNITPGEKLIFPDPEVCSYS